MVKPQPPFTHSAVRAIIEDITQSSVMRLDPVSMDRLWDLITMVFKWQVTLSPDLLAITLRHLYEIETYVINPDTHLQLHRVQTVVENFNKIFDQNEKHQIRHDVLGWLQNYNIRVSLLIRMGLQGADGSFIANNTNLVAQDMLKNLGENIYAVTQNGKVADQNNQLENKMEEKEGKESHELQAFVDQMLGDRKLSTGSTENAPALKLLIDDQNEKKDEIRLEIFDNIDASARDNKLQKIFNDLNLDDVESGSSINDDLLEIIGSETV
ncbi:hypothetical protein ILUMI_09352 [Ignelater luminosus]|uniref:Uncharacterized protein n=1 Tax=Ignelater luminosus TaxID=2038154 RepID=A0A8K0D4E4_IGNLU|nr:hypothetical protein ILUMI_09352 [Ignelater luminosus]